jgi:hypothetical protein
MVRSVLGILGGLMAGFWLILGVETIGSLIYPPSVLIDWNKPETIELAMKSAPVGQLIFVLVAWSIGTFVGSGITARVASSHKIIHGMVIGVFFQFAGIQQMRMWEHPTWFWFAGLSLFLPLAFLGARLVTLAPTEKPASIEELP